MLAPSALLLALAFFAAAEAPPDVRPHPAPQCPPPTPPPPQLNPLLRKWRRHGRGQVMENFTADKNDDRGSLSFANYAITLAVNATPLERFAAGELRTLLLQTLCDAPDCPNAHEPSKCFCRNATQSIRRAGPQLPILSPAAATLRGLRQMAVGSGSAQALGVATCSAAADGPCLGRSQLGDEGYVVCSFDDGSRECGLSSTTLGSSIAMTGAEGAPRGTLYAVYHYLEQLGFRFIAPDETVVPAAPARLPPARTSFVPRFELRDNNAVSDHLCYWPDCEQRKLWAVRTRHNVLFHDNSTFAGFGPVRSALKPAVPPGESHTAYNFFVFGDSNCTPNNWPAWQGPPKRWFESHREWFWRKR